MAWVLFLGPLPRVLGERSDSSALSGLGAAPPAENLSGRSGYCAVPPLVFIKRANEQTTTPQINLHLQQSSTRPPGLLMSILEYHRGVVSVGCPMSETWANISVYFHGARIY